MTSVKPVNKGNRKRLLCMYLGIRTEHKAGCWQYQKHKCDKGLPVAIPATVCQKCPEWRKDNQHG